MTLMAYDGVVLREATNHLDDEQLVCLQIWASYKFVQVSWLCRWFSRL